MEGREVTQRELMEVQRGFRRCVQLSSGFIKASLWSGMILLANAQVHGADVPKEETDEQPNDSK